MSAVLATRPLARRAAFTRRNAPKPAAAHDHDVVLRPFVPDAAGSHAAAMIVRRMDQAFVNGLLSDLRDPAGLARLSTQIARDQEGGTLKLFLPLHRAFNLVLLEAACDRPGQPRLDQKKIDSLGLVLRRIADDGKYQSWCSAGTALRGWLKADASPQPQNDPDPDPTRRKPALSAGNAEINRLLALRKVTEPLTEDVAPLFVAPPDICEAAGRTLLYGLVPVTSAELSELPTAPPDYSDQRSEIAAHLSHYLKAGNEFALPRAGTLIAGSWADETAVQLEESQAASQASETTANVGHFLLLLRQLVTEFDAFNPAIPEAAALLKLLNEKQLVMQEVVYPEWNGSSMQLKTQVLRTLPAGEFLKQAAQVLVLREANATQLTMALRWPALDASYAKRLLDAVLAAMSARFAAIKPAIGRFDGLTRRYAVRGFIRVKRDDGCPPQLVWSDYSKPFVIAAWYDSAGAPPVQITLPDLSDRNALKKLKPNVAFQLPASLANMLNANDAKDMADGKGKSGGGLGVGWICSFNLPVITLCAFIVLNIFLKLFDIIFGWMAFIKICIPYPKKGGD